MHERTSANVRCHCSQIGDLRFFRSEAYQALFRSLDAEGGFYTERVRLSLSLSRCATEGRGRRLMFEPDLPRSVGRRARASSRARRPRFDRPGPLVRPFHLLFFPDWPNGQLTAAAPPLAARSFADLGYQHDWFFHCPARSTRRVGLRQDGDEDEDDVLGCECECPREGELQGRKKGQETVDMGASVLLPPCLAPLSSRRGGCIERTEMKH